MHAILTGATGLIGSAALDAMLKTKEITKITVISRRPVKMVEDAKDPRVNVILHSDFEHYDNNLLEQLRGATGCVWALGISQTQVGKEEYVKITKDYALAAAKAFSEMTRSTGEPFNFVYVSGSGATLEPGRFSPIFARVKGETERELARMRDENPLLKAYTVRPGFIDYAMHDAIRNYMPAQGLVRDAAFAAFGPLTRSCVKSQWSPTQPLGRFLTDIALSKWKEDKFVGPKSQFDRVGSSGFTIIENPGFRKLMRLD